MPTKDLHHRLTGDPTSLERANTRAARSFTAAEREAKRLEEQQRRTERAMRDIGRTMVVAGAAIAAGIGLSVRAAIQWESAWADVAKVLNNATEPQLAILEEQLRGLARELPQSHQEIAAVAAAAGQLGVAAPDIAEFTRTMVDLGVTTNLTSEQAAFAIARMANIMGTAQEDVGRLASVIVDLGNNSATTEADITEMALRIAGAGQTIGLSESQVLGFAAALSSVGIRAQAGGTAISRVFLEIDTAVSQGGETLDTFAETAGMSAGEFRQAYERDAGAATAAFVAGLGEVQTSGGDVNAVLADLGITEIRTSDALRRMAGAGDLLADALDTGSRAWDENIALTEEAERRYGTTEARIAIAKNQVNDFAISIGQTFLPAVGEMVDRIGALAELFNEMPGWMQTAIAIVGALTAALLLAGGAALLVVPRIAAFRLALDQLALSSGRTATAVGALRTGMSRIPWGPLGLAVGAATVAFGLFAAKQAEARRAAREFADTLDEVTGAVTESSRVLAAHKLFDSDEAEDDAAKIRAAADQLGLSVSDLVDIVLSGENAMDRLNSAVAEGNDGFFMMDGQLRRTASTSDEQARAWVVLADATERVSGELVDGQELWEILQEGIEGAEGATRDLTPEQERLADQFGVSGEAAAGLSDELSGLDDELRTLFDSVFGLQNAQDALDDQFDRIREQVKRQREEEDKHAGALDGSSEAARRNREESQKLLQAYGDLVLETLGATNSQEEAEEASRKFEEQLDKLEEQTGINIRELEGYNDVAAEIERLIEVHFTSEGVQRTEQEIRSIQRRLDALDRTVDISFNVQGFDSAAAGGTFVPRHTGGPIPGFGGQDSRLVAATPGEFMVSTLGASRNRAALEAANAGARLAVVGTGGGSASASAAAPGGTFTGTLTLSSGELLGVVDGRIEQREERLVDMITAGTGASR